MKRYGFMAALLWACLMAGCPAGAQQRLGLPRIINFTIDDYEAATQNWDIATDSLGVTYFGNNYGLVAYNGHHWGLILQPQNKTIMRSLCLAPDGRLYMGASNEIGYMVRNGVGQSRLHSLVPLVSEEHRDFSDIWNVLSLNSKVYFVASNLILVYDGGRMMELPFADPIEYSGVVGGQLYFSQKGKGLFMLEGTHPKPLPNTQALHNQRVKAMLPLKGQKLLNASPAGEEVPGYLICTEKGGVFRYKSSQLEAWQTPVNKALEGITVNTAMQLSSGHYAFGTIKEGLFIASAQGKLVMRLHRPTGLQDNSVIALHEDAVHNLWLALDNGISYVELGSDFYYLDERSGLEGSIYAIATKGDTLFAGSNHGLYHRSLNAGPGTPFAFAPGFEEQIWHLNASEEQLLVGSHTGAYRARGLTLDPVNTLEDGAWQFVHPPNRPDLLIQGSYQGMFLLRNQGGRWGQPQKIANFDVVTRECLFDDQGYLWVEHGYNGVYRLKLSPDYTTVEEIRNYNQESGLPSNLFTNLFHINGEVLFGTVSGIYAYDPQREEIVPHARYQEMLGTQQLIRSLTPMPGGGLFFIKGYDNEDEAGILSFGPDGRYHIQYLPFQKLRGELMPAFEEISFLPNGTMLLGAKKGIMVYQPGLVRDSVRYHATIHHVTLTNARDSLLFGQGDVDMYYPSQEGPQTHALPYAQNALKVNFSATYYEMPENIVFQTWLEGFETGWTDWTPSRSREFTNLREGEYTFHVRAKNVYGQPSEADAFRFSVHPPWYRSVWMYGVYGVLALLALWAVWGLRSLQIRQLRRKQALALEKQKQEHLQRNLENERKLRQLETDKLLSEIEHKNEELASSTMNLMRLNQTVLGFKEKLEGVPLHDIVSAKKKLEGLSKAVDELVADDQNWEHFEMLFNQVHDNFIQRLKGTYSELTVRDIRLCAYLRMNLTTKEIAPLMGISYRAIEAMRYRVRKKMALEGQDNLAEFIIGF